VITYLRGAVQEITAAGIVLDVGGIGMEVLATSRCRAGLQPGTVATVPVSLIVREDSWTLFGFADADERFCFQALQAAKGVGPKVAVNLLSALTPDQLRRAVAAGDATALTAAPGIGAKGAARLVIDLRDRLGPARPDSGAAPAAAAPSAGWRRDVQQALAGLGWNPSDAATAIARIEQAAEPGGPARRSDGTPDVPVLLRLALRSLDRTAGAS
jgi:Holliday junction DNA helicase RuvA